MFESQSLITPFSLQHSKALSCSGDYGGDMLPVHALMLCERVPDVLKRLVCQAVHPLDCANSITQVIFCCAGGCEA